MPPCNEHVDLLGAGGAESPLKRPATAVAPELRGMRLSLLPSPKHLQKLLPRERESCSKGQSCSKVKAKSLEQNVEETKQQWSTFQKASN